MTFHYLIGTPKGIRYFTEPHKLGLFTHDEYLAAFRDCGLKVAHYSKGLMGRELYVGMKSDGSVFDNSIFAFGNSELNSWQKSRRLTPLGSLFECVGYP